MIIPTILYLTALLTPSLAQRVNVLYEWNYPNFTWPTVAAYSKALNSGAYIPKNNIVAGIKIWKGQIYLSLPRWKQGVPVTLAMVPVALRNGDRAPLLQPYPNWQMQQLGVCSSLQFVQSMEIDPKGRMWVLENGRTQFNSEQPRTECPSRLIIFDLENKGKVLLDYPFPKNVVYPNSVFLNDIVLDHEDGGWAYISDSDREYPGIIVFSLKGKNSWKVSHSPSMQAPTNPIRIAVNGSVVEVGGPIDGIALSPASIAGNRIVYFAPLSDYEMFTIPARVLKNPRLGVKNWVRPIGWRSSPSNGLVVTAKADMYFGRLIEDSVSRWPISTMVFTKQSQELVFRDANVNQWPDTFAVDEVGRLWWVSNRIPRFQSNQIDINESNYRVIFIEINDRNYMYYRDFSSPKFPDIREDPSILAYFLNFLSFLRRLYV